MGKLLTFELKYLIGKTLDLNSRISSKISANIKKAAKY